MGNLVYAINLTLDGCCDHTKGSPDDALLDYYTRLLRGVDLLLYGRKTYELMVPYWPDVAKNPDESKADRDFAEAFVSKRKIVFSRTLENGEGPKCEVREDGPARRNASVEERTRWRYFGGRSGHPVAADRAGSGGRISVCDYAGHRGRRQAADGRREPAAEIAIETCRGQDFQVGKYCASLPEAINRTRTSWK